MNVAFSTGRLLNLRMQRHAQNEINCCNVNGMMCMTLSPHKNKQKQKKLSDTIQGPVVPSSII